MLRPDFSLAAVLFGENWRQFRNAGKLIFLQVDFQFYLSAFLFGASS